jgi:pilus assembly protein CpaB
MRRFLFLLIAVLALGLVGSAFLRPSARGIDAPVVTAEPVSAAEPAGLSILVATKPLATGTLLRAEDLRWDPWPLTDVPEGFVLRGHPTAEMPVGSVLRRPFAQGEPIAAGQVVSPGERGFLAAVLTPGSRAVSVAVDAVTAAAGLIWPGDRIDLILMQTFDGDNDAAKAVGETVLRDLRVLALDSRLSHEEDAVLPTSRDAAIPRTVTLEVSPREAEMVAVAAGLGRLALSLRSLGNERAADRVVDIPHSSASSQRSLPQPAAGHGQAPGERAVSSTWAAEVSPALAGRRMPKAIPAATPPTAPERPRIQVLRGESGTR